MFNVVRLLECFRQKCVKSFCSIEVEIRNVVEILSPKVLQYNIAALIFFKSTAAIFVSTITPVMPVSLNIELVILGIPLLSEQF